MRGEEIAPRLALRTFSRLGVITSKVSWMMEKQS